MVVLKDSCTVAAPVATGRARLQQGALTGVDRGHQELSDLQVSAKSHKPIKSYGLSSIGHGQILLPSSFQYKS